MPDRLVEGAAFVMDDADIVMRLRQVRIERECGAAGGERRIALPGEAMHLAEIAVIQRDLAVRGNRAAHQLDRRRQVARLVGDDAPQMQRTCVVGMGAQGVLAKLLGLREPARLHVLLRQRQRLRQGQRDLVLIAGAGVAHKSLSLAGAGNPGELARGGRGDLLGGLVEHDALDVIADVAAIEHVGDVG